MGILSTHGVSFAGITYPDLTFPQGGVHVICGPSGCGKTSLLRLCNRTLEPATGCVCFMDRDVRDIPPLALRKDVLLAGQEVFLFPGSIAENFRQFHVLRESPVPPAERMAAFLRLCAFDAPLGSPCEQLSGGERQRVFLAIHLSFVPRVLLLDEPTSALDATTARCFMEHLCRFGREQDMTVVMVSHDRALAAAWADSLTELGGRA